MQCRKCGSKRLMSRGRSFECKDCGAFTQKNYKGKKPSSMDEESSRVEYGNDYINVVLTSRRMFTVDDIISEFKIDTSKWELVPPLIITTHEGYRKDRKVEWDVDNGKVTYGHVRDSGKLIIAPLVGITARFKLKVEEIKATRIFESFIENAKKVAPKYPKINYPKIQDGLLYEIALPDMQLGRMVMGTATNGSDLTPESIIRKADNVIDALIGMTSGFKVSRVLFPVGNDFFDCDNIFMTTMHGTPQQDDPRWQLVFDMGKEFLIRTTDKLTQLAPVDLVVIPGNHDETKMYFLGSVLQAQYHANPNVTVDNAPKLRKYYRFENNLIGLTHGYYEKYPDLGSLMTSEAKELWAATCNWEWHVGDRHHKADMLFKTEELKPGIVVRIMRSLASPSVWEFNKGFVGSLRAAEGFLWHPVRGVIAQFTATE